MIATAHNQSLALPPPETQSKQEIIGSTGGLRFLLDAVRMVAPGDTAVLISGETGTGKELIARRLHELSARSHGPYIRVNCAVIPAGLLESELFGHERGAFTGAWTQTTGRFQLADRGTIFLDEMGDLPLELQPKLLRVLQEKEFERLGSSRTIRVNIRIVAATNLDLAQMVRERRFRADLFYRLSVLPLCVPPLRERSEDIPELVWHFARRFGAKMHKEIDVISDAVMEMIRRHNWPGNIRELQNFMERAVIMSSGRVLRPPMDDLHLLARDRTPASTGTLAEAERDHIVEALGRSGWTVGGRQGAAARLGLPRTTLMARMRRYGIHQSLTAGATA